MKLIPLIEGRRGERLVQALIRYASKDQEFREAFRKYFNFPPNPEPFNEEVPGKGIRYDLVLNWKDKPEVTRHVELKLWADFTVPQKRDLLKGGGIHGVILPATRLQELAKLNPAGDATPCTWEQFASDIANSTPTAIALFHDLQEYIGKNTIEVSAIPRAMYQYKRSEWDWHNNYGEMYRYLNNIKSTLQEIDETLYSTTRKGSDDQWYYGFKTYSEKLGGDAWVWIGFVSGIQDESLKGRVGLYAQASTKMNEYLNWPVTSSHWWWATGFAAKEIKPDGDRWTRSGIRSQLRELLQPLIEMPVRGDEKPPPSGSDAT